MDAPARRKRDRVDVDDEIAAPGDFKRRRLDYEDHDGHVDRIRERSLTRLSHDDYNVGWICALHIEMAAAKAMLDNVHDSLPKHSNDSNTYTVGNIGRHNIVIASLPANGYGTNNAATVANHMDRTFPSIRMRLMVGIGGGVPGKADVRLGDVVVSTEVWQYDMGKTMQDGHFYRTGTPRRPPPAVMTAVTKLRSNHESEPSRIPSILSEMFQRNPRMSQYVRPSSLPDRLFDSGYNHIESMITCDRCDESKLLERSHRDNNNPKIHYGVIASGNQVMKHGKTRDQLAQELGILCFEMEAAGLMDNFPCLVIRGICDYSDSHKNKQWQEYAAATAAAYAKELLSVVHSNEIQEKSTVTLSSIAGQEALQDQRKALLDSLRFEQIDSRQANIKAAHRKTCKWLLQHPDYVDWLDPAKFSQHNGFLWIKGKPGAGKSTLMKFAYLQAKKKTFQDGLTASFFFNARGDDLEKSTAGMYRSLLLQLLETLPDLQKVLDTPDLVLRHQRPSFTWETGMLCDLFAEAIERLGERPLACFIDALDECGEDQVRKMIEHFENLGQHSFDTGAKLYICFSSRHYPHIDIQHGRQLILEDQVGHGQDLEKYVRSNLTAGTGKFVEDIRTEILQKAAGVFMWAVLVVDILNKEFSRGRNFAVKKRLREIPAKLSELFKDILTRDNENMADLLLCIQWILYANGPLKREEFYFAVVSGLEPEQAMVEWNPEYITADTMNLFVLSSSKGLAEVTRSKDYTVQFIHESVRDFLIRDNGLHDLWPDLAEDFPSMSHDRLKQLCYNYIQMDISVYVGFDKTLPKATSVEAKDLRQRIAGKFPFLQYATRNVLYHADMAATGLPQADFLKSFNLGSWKHLNNVFAIYETRRYMSSVSLLYILAETNLAELIKAVLHYRPEEFHEQGGRYRYPLFAALTSSHRNAVTALLQLEHSPSKDDITARLEYGRDLVAHKWQTPLSWAAMKGHKGIAQMLLGKGAEADAKGNKGQTPLWWATRNGYKEIVQLLLDSGAEIDSKGSDGQTPLWGAAVNGHKETVQLLLDSGAEANTKDNDGQTPLWGAAVKGYKEIVQLLLDSGVKADTKTNNGEMPLSGAARNGHREIVQLLLDSGAEIDSKDNSGQTPLWWAAVKGYKEIVQLLLDSGAKADTKTNNGEMPLSGAARNGQKEIVQLLLDSGAEIDSKDNSGQTPFSGAARNGHKATVQLLLDRGAEADAKDNNGQTPLWGAAVNGHKESVQLLLDSGAEADAKDNDGQTPLWGAVRNGHKETVQLLLDRGAEADTKDDDGRTPLSWIARNATEHNRANVSAFSTARPNAYAFLTAGSNMALQDYQMQLMLLEHQNKKRLMARIMANSVAVMRLLLDNGAEADSKDRDGRTPLSWVAANGSKEVVQMLLDKGVEADSKDNHGQTPLFWAAEKGHEEIVQLLLDSGAKSDAKASGDQTPLSVRPY
ncbi:hypothetical protein DL770_005836 [Monosporascus sp. CRB-9-2]|nr:hypothetical protein DL770_005836 [Monosporascus sp. CRB-9-2]